MWRGGAAGASPRDITTPRRRGRPAHAERGQLRHRSTARPTRISTPQTTLIHSKVPRIDVRSRVSAGMGAIFAVAGNVEDRAEILLQFERLAHELFRSRVVVDRRQDWECLFTGKKDCLGMAHVFARQKGKREFQRRLMSAQPT